MNELIEELKEWKVRGHVKYTLSKAKLLGNAEVPVRDLKISKDPKVTCRKSMSYIQRSKEI